jgi:hypothetical protein
MHAMPPRVRDSSLAARSIADDAIGEAAVRRMLGADRSEAS